MLTIYYSTCEKYYCRVQLDCNTLHERIYLMGTKTLTVSELRSNLADSLDAIQNDEILIITRRGKKERAIIDLDRLEDLLAVANPEYLKTIKEARASKDYFAHEEVFGDI